MEHKENLYLFYNFDLISFLFLAGGLKAPAEFMASSVDFLDLNREMEKSSSDFDK